MDNSPHPLLFAPVARHFEASGHTVLMTARDNAQTEQLARERWPDVAMIGGPSPPGRVAKARTMAQRAIDLRRWAKANAPDVALSHNSYGQIIAAKQLRIPAVTAMDYEFQPANHIAFRLAKTVILPAALRSTVVKRQGAADRKTTYYSGLKEEMYLADFEPDTTILHQLGIDLGSDGMLVVARTAPDLAIYHSFENPIFVQCVKQILRNPKATVVVLPRHPGQRAALADLGERCVVVDKAWDSRSLMSQADLMLGAGGTMTREAALMGVPTVSLFAGKRPAVDEWLEDQGMLSMLRDIRDLPEVERQPRADRMSNLRERGTRLVDEFCDAVTGV